jgi:hypothetical protein
MAFSFNNVCRNTLPAGTYEVQINEVKIKGTPEKGALYNLEVHYVVSKGAYAKRTLVDTIYEKAFSFRLKPFLSAVGIDLNREFDTAKELYEYGAAMAKGKTILVEVGERTYNGNVYNEVKTWSPLPSSTTSVDDVISEFNTIPDAMPKAPRIDDLPAPTFDGDYAPIAEIVDEDLPF